MDTLPLELKQRVCSYLTPRDLKSLRVASKDYAAAACRYFIPRIFLCNHPNSFQEIQDIANHPDLRHSVTTLIIDVSMLISFPNYCQWASIFEDPEWDSADSKSSKVSKHATGEVDTREQDILHREKKKREQWMSYQRQATLQREKHSRELMLESITFAFQRCPKLRNLIVDFTRLEKSGSALVKKRRHFYTAEIPLSTEFLYHYSPWTDTTFTVWELFKPIHDADRALESLVLLDPQLLYGRPPPTSVFSSLKHLRAKQCLPSVLKSIVASASGLESFGTHGLRRYVPNHSSSIGFLKSLPPLQKLRACSLKQIHNEDDLVHFLLRQSSTLQQLKITDAYYDTFVSRVKGKLPNLRHVQFQELFSRSARTYSRIEVADVLQDHEHEVETGPMEIEGGLWEDYEQLFFLEEIEEMES
ncbi:hypothetical protein E4T48_01248 [Aureobasidium sp. EXF-10727]|nr:hypothetical protein E4T48_01248 [Aureobasidium sp. EXF-10727]